MNKIIIMYICMSSFLFSGNYNTVIEKSYAEVGIASIVEKKDDVIINIYSINTIPIAGVQFQIIPNDLFTIDSISGGICSDLDFLLRSNDSGLLLAFSLEGREIPVSKSSSVNDNILFSVYGKKNKTFFNQVITLQTTLANKMGKKINSKVVDYIYK